MNNKVKINLGEVQSTLLIPLYGRAKEYEKEHPLIKDKYAHDIIEKIDFDFETEFQQMPIQMSINSTIRTYHLDSAISRFIGQYPDATIVNIGAGLDTTFQRIDNGRIFWYDLDLPDSIALRRKLIPETNRNIFISKSVFDTSWFQDIKERRSKVFFMAAGVLVYLEEGQIKPLFLKLIQQFPGSEIEFDIYSKMFLWLRNNLLANRNKKSKVIANWHWGVNSGKAITKWSDKITIIDEFPYYSRIDLEKYWDAKSLSFIKAMNFFNPMKMLHLKLG
ncbi:MAG: class I SAM-dependent methyltransferase [Bacteroidota bacterium]